MKIYKVGQISNDALDFFNKNGFRLIEHKTILDWDIALVQGFIFGGDPDADFYQIGFQRKGRNFTDLGTQFKTFVPESTPQDWQNFFSELKNVLDGWISKYGKLYVISLNNERQDKYVRILKKLGYSVGEEYMSGFKVNYIS